MNKRKTPLDTNNKPCPATIEYYCGDAYVEHQIKSIHAFFGYEGGIDFVFERYNYSILDLIETCNDGDSVLILETYGLTKGYWSLEEIGNACLKKGVSFEMLNPPFKHCDSKESKKTLLAIEFSNMMIRDYPIHYPEDDE